MGSDKEARKKLTKKIINIVLKIMYQILIIFCVLLTMVIVLQKVTNGNKSIAGYRLFRVITGSMIPEYDVGEVVIARETNPNEIKVGDDIVYQGNFGEYNGKIIMHKVTQIDKNEDGTLTFHAKGLHSASVEDPLIRANQIYGVVKLKSGLLTLLYKLASSIYSAFIIITVLVLNVYVSFRFTGKTKRVQVLEETEDEEYYEDEEYETEYDEEYEDEEYDEEEIEEDEE